MASSLPIPDIRRIRSYITRLPLATRIEFLIVTVFYLVHLGVPGITQWGSLIPQEVHLTSRT